jgi:hypothetical protein
MILDRSDVFHDKYEMHCAVTGVRMPCVEAADIRAAMHNQVPSRALRYRAFSNQSHHYSNCFMLHTAASTTITATASCFTRRPSTIGHSNADCRTIHSTPGAQQREA